MIPSLSLANNTDCYKALTDAVSHGRVDQVERILLEAGADVNIKRYDGKTLLDVVCERSPLCSDRYT